ncbi:hypothetical protein Bhyg_03309 [Pseudolycoriella hygida]|uniref:Uncharacterized protein n=1 Tax=Pseudolycoriella hygida TaxID=35572 RepID=A0A9Q0S7E8_9DIPT|nr:hypothetical protein Bhyg_03309 [Pseudolycoriella hygida]
MNSLEDALNELKTKRILSVPAKYRDPSKSDIEVNGEQAKRKRYEVKQRKMDAQAAKRKNMNLIAPIERKSIDPKKLVKTPKEKTIDAKTRELKAVEPRAKGATFQRLMREKTQDSRNYQEKDVNKVIAKTEQTDNLEENTVANTDENTEDTEENL